MDGATPQKERMGIVEKFNTTKEPGMQNRDSHWLNVATI